MKKQKQPLSEDHTPQKYFEQAIDLIPAIKPNSNPYQYSRWGQMWFDVKYGGFISNLAKGLMCAEFNSDENTIKNNFSQVTKEFDIYYGELKSSMATSEDFNLAAKVADTNYPPNGNLENYLNHLKLKEEESSIGDIPQTEHLLLKYFDLSYDPKTNGAYFKNPKNASIRDFLTKSLEDFSDYKKFNNSESTVKTLKNRGII